VIAFFIGCNRNPKAQKEFTVLTAEEMVISSTSSFSVSNKYKPANWLCSNI